MSDTNVALIGLGAVGSGVAKLPIESGERLQRRAGRRLVLKHVVVQDLAKKREFKLPAAIVSDDLLKITGDPQISIVALLMGGLEPARTIALEVLNSGKDPVTANK